MWFFMYACYIFSFLTFLMLGAAWLQNIFYFHILHANHLTFIILTSIVYFFTETLVIFFFVGTGVSVRDYSKEHQLGDAYRKESFRIKMKLYPPLLLNMLFMIIAFVLVGAVDTRNFPGPLFRVYFLCCFFHYIYVKIIQNECFRENTDVILRMSGVLPR